ncbi:MAG: toxin-antitoxin system YwqK family antitoxin [Bacteroidota bacterium]
MRITLFAIFTLSLAANCGGLELVVEKNEEGVIIEEYTVKPKSQEREGLYKSFDSNGRLIEEATYLNGKLNGERRVYYESGEVESIETYEADTYQGRFLSFYENGKVQLQGDYVNNNMEGEWKGYYKNGRLKEVVQFERNNENGPFIEYHDNGNLKAKGNYLNGDNEHGALELYDESGSLERKMECENGHCRTTWTVEKG